MWDSTVTGCQFPATGFENASATVAAVKPRWTFKFAVT